jgi:hypothetical protein
VHFGTHSKSIGKYLVKNRVFDPIWCFDRHRVGRENAIASTFSAVLLYSSDLF